MESLQRKVHSASLPMLSQPRSVKISSCSLVVWMVSGDNGEVVVWEGGHESTVALVALVHHNTIIIVEEETPGTKAEAGDLCNLHGQVDHPVEEVKLKVITAGHYDSIN